MKRTKVYIAVILIIFISQLFFWPIKSEAGFLSDLFTQSKTFLYKGKYGANNENSSIVNAEDINSPMAQIFNALIAIATVIAVIVGGILGIKFMMASAEDKAQIKEALIPYVLGCAVIFGAYGIWKLVVTVLAQI